MLLLCLVLTTCADREPVLADAEEERIFGRGGLGDMVAAADLVLEGTVVATAVGRKFGAGEGSLWFRDVTVEVHEIFDGEAQPRVVFEETGWDSERPVVVNGYEGSQKGDRAIYFLVEPDRVGDGPRYQVMTHAQGRFLLRGDGSIDGPDTSSLVRDIESLTPERFRARLRQLGTVGSG